MDDTRTALARLKASRSQRRAADADARYATIRSASSRRRLAPRSYTIVLSRRVPSRTSSVRAEFQLTLRLTHRRDPFVSPCSPAAPPPRHAASASHVENDAYMKRMEDGFRAMGFPADDDRDDVLDRARRPSDRARGRPPAPAQPPRASALPPASSSASSLARGWYVSPLDPSGVVADLSDRPLSCASVSPSLDAVVVGGTDHALYEVSLTTGRKTRQLYSKAHGHREWVTCVTHARDGRVASGGMDSKICVWDARGCRAADLEGHAGSVAALATLPGDALASASYDKTVRVWSLPGRGRPRGECVGTMRGSAPQTTARWSSSRGLATGDRSGGATVWDARAARATWRLEDAHRGHLTALAWISSLSGTGTIGDAGDAAGDVLATGGQDGAVRLRDPRGDPRASPIASVPAHVPGDVPGAAGAVGDIAQTADGRVVSVGADGNLAVLDPRRGRDVVAKIPLGDFAYSLAIVGDLALAGTGSGHVHVVDVAGRDSGGVPKTLYALGANEGATRAIVAVADAFAAAGDDGRVASYRFER